MSDAHNEHESLIKTPKQLIAAVLAGFIVPIIVIVLLVHYVGSTPTTGAGSNAQSPEAIAARIKPIADVGYTLNDTGAPAAAAPAAPAASPAAAGAPAAPVAAAPAAPAKAAAIDGKKIYEAACIACHGAGIAGAPKLGDKAAWGPRIKQGKDTLYVHAIKGFQGKAGMMPAKGGSSASDDEVKAAVDYMIAASK